MTKATYLSNVFPISIQIITKIHKKIEYLRQSKVELITRKTLFQQKINGGLNLKESEIHNISMKVKHMLSLKEQTQAPPWTFLATYWLATYLYNLSSDYNYFKSNNRIKAFNLKTPFCYYDLVDYIKNQNNTIIKGKPITKTIYQTMLIHGCKEHTIFGEILWKNKIFNIYFAKIWKYTYHSFCLPHHTYLHYKILHYAIKTHMNTHINVVEIKPISPYCGFCNITEAILHLLINCTTIKTIWTCYHSYYQKINKQFTPYQHILTISSNGKDKQTKRLNFNKMHAL